MLFLAFRHLRARKSQTILTLMGIILGTMAFVVISGMMLGFREYLIAQLLDNDAHIHISAREDVLEPHTLDTSFFPKAGYVHWIIPPSGNKNSPKIQNPTGWYQLLVSDPRVVAFSPQFTTQIILSKGGISVSSRLIGVEAEKQSQVTNLANHMTVGKFTDIAGGGNRLILGEDLLKKLGSRVGDTLMVSNGTQAPIPFKVSGSFSVGMKNIDEGTVYGAINDAQAISLRPSHINEISVKITDVNQAAEIASGWSKLSQELVQSWDQVNANFFSVFKIQDAVRYMMTGSILIVAGFSIYNILNMVITQKRQEIAILRSMGYEQNDIVVLFLVQGIILGIVGGSLGVLIGYFACKGLSKVPFAGGTMGRGSGTMMVSFNPKIYLSGVILSVLASIVASWLPARVAGKMTPIDIIRSES